MAAISPARPIAAAGLAYSRETKVPRNEWHWRERNIFRVNGKGSRAVMGERGVR